MRRLELHLQDDLLPSHSFIMIRARRTGHATVKLQLQFLWTYAATDTWCLGANRLKWCTSHIKESTLKYILLPTYVSNWNLKWGLSLNFNSRVSNQMILLRTLIHPGEYYVYYLRAATTLYWPIRCCSCPCMIVNFLPMIRGMFICSIFFTKLICRMELRQTAVP